jgi:hypothetical protein
VDSFEHKTSLLSSSTQEAPSEDRTGGHDDRDDRLHAGDYDCLQATGPFA